MHIQLDFIRLDQTAGLEGELAAGHGAEPRRQLMRVATVPRPESQGSYSDKLYIYIYLYL